MLNHEQGIEPKFNAWRGCNDDEVSPHIYQPISAQYKMFFKMNMTPADTASWIRIDFIKARKQLRSSTVHELNLPQGLPHFGYIAEDSMVCRNEINPTYWGKLMKTKWIKFHAPKDTITASHPVERMVTFNFRFNQTLKPDMDETSIDGSKFYLNVPINQQYWVVISTSNTQPYSGIIQGRRKIAWRDQHGSAT